MAHNGSIVPVPGRDIFVQSWYQGGISVIDFTDSAKPVEIAYFDRGPIDAENLVFGGYWSSYWYNGFIYGTETLRGIDVLALEASEHLTANEIEAAQLADYGGAFNPQQQFPVSWPAEPVVARAYLDQLERSSALSASMLADVRLALDHATQQGSADHAADTLQSLAGKVKCGNASEEKRCMALADTLLGIAAGLR